MKKIYNFLIVFILFLFAFSFYGIETNAINDDETVLLVIEPKIDPRIKENGNSILVGFINKETDTFYETYLYDTSNYRTKIYVEPGDYKLCQGDVSGDYEGKYEFDFITFTAENLTTIISFNVGDPNYSGEIEKSDKILYGDIDREETDKLLEEDGKSKVNWDKVDNPEKYKNEESDDNKNKEEENTNKDDENNGENNNSDDKNDKNKNNKDKNEKLDEETNKKNKRNAIFFIIIIVIICGIVIFYRIKNAPIYDTEE